MAEGLARKKRIRAGHRGSTTRVLTQVDTLTTSDTEGAPDRTKLAQLKLTLTEKLETLRCLDEEILELAEEGDLEGEIEQADTFKQGVYGAMVKIDHVCEKSSVTPPPTPPTGSSGRGTRTDASDRPHGHQVRLPKLTIKPFAGEVTYEAAIHLNTEISDIDKFNYLRSFLERSARESISGLTLTAANYREAVEILKRRFGNTQQIIARHMDILLKAEAVSSQYHLKSLRHLYDTIETHVRGLRALGIASDSYGSLLTSVLLNKLPQELRLLLSRKIGGEDSWSLDTLMGELRLEIEARERAAAASLTPGSQTRKYMYTKEPHTTAALMTTASNPFCCFCNQSHPSDKCRVITQVEARKQIVRKSGRCFVCLKRGHIGRECRARLRCSKCSGKHHIAICSATKERQGSGGLPPKTPVKPTDGERSGLNPMAPPFSEPRPDPSTTLYVDASRTVLLQTAQTILYNPESPQTTIGARVILDPGSQRSYITERARTSLKLKPTGQQCMSISTFGSGGRSSQTCDVVKVGVQTREGHECSLELFVVPLICEPLRFQPISACMERYAHLTKLELADSSDGEGPMGIDVLVGSDCYWDLVTGEVRRGAEGPVAIRTKFGWVLTGPIPFMEQAQLSTSLMTTHTLRIDAQSQADHTLEESLQSFWKLESLGIVAPERSVLEEFGESIEFKEGRYEVSLPWKEQYPVLPDNYQLSLNRLRGLVRRLRHDPTILQEYHTTIQNQLRQGIVEVVEDPDSSKSGMTHYLPHHAVIRKDKTTTKVRIVYDASAKAAGHPSLNDCLFRGPKFDQKILDILLRFRTHKIALTADIEKAFLMVSVSKKDRDVLRFLWIGDLTSDEPPVHVFRFTRVTFGVTSSPFLLNATIEHHLNKFSSSFPELVEQLKRSIYVDDVVTGAESEEAAYQAYLDSKHILKEGGFNLRKFVTSSSTLQAKIDEEQASSTPSEQRTDETYAKSTLGSTQRLRSGEQKILGVPWDVGGDRLVFDISEVALKAKDIQPTKRNVVSTVDRFYDPIGFLSPLIIRFKILFQRLCESQIGWDERLTGDLLREWLSLISDLQGGTPLSIPRYFLEESPAESLVYRLHGFCDASKAAYATVVYLVIQTPVNSAVRFVASKSRVSPLREQTIPRLELLSTLLLARLVANITESTK